MSTGINVGPTGYGRMASKAFDLNLLSLSNILHEYRRGLDGLIDVKQYGYQVGIYIFFYICDSRCCYN